MGKVYTSHLEIKKDRETPFNMAMLYYLQLSDLMKRKNNAIIEGDWNTAIESLEEMFTLISFKLDDKEISEIEDYFTKMRFVIPDDMDDFIQRNEMINRKIMFRKANRTIMQCLNKYNMIFPNIDTTSNMDKLKGRYDI